MGYSLERGAVHPTIHNSTMSDHHRLVYRFQHHHLTRRRQSLFFQHNCHRLHGEKAPRGRTHHSFSVQPRKMGACGQPYFSLLPPSHNCYDSLPYCTKPDVDPDELGKRYFRISCYLLYILLLLPR
jgi:hypothetical protein